MRSSQTVKSTQVWQFDRLGGPEHLQLRELEVAPPGPGEALVRIEAIGLNRSDLLFMHGRYLTQPPSPSCLGQEAVGTVVALGPGDGPCTLANGKPVAVGDRVALLAGRVDYAGTGAYRQHGVYDQSALLPWPANMEAPAAAALWVAGLTAVGGLRAGGLTPENASGRRVVITAASSGVGVIALQIARAWGAVCIAATTSAGKVPMLEELAHRVALAAGPQELAPALDQATDGAGFDLGFDPVGFAYLPALFQAAASEGQIVSYGIMAGTEAPFDLVSLLRKDLGVHGFTIYRLLRQPQRLQTAVADLLALVDQGQIEPRVATTFPFSEAPAALEAMAKNRHLGKLVVTTD